MKRIDVAVGIVFDEFDRVLVGQRVVEDLYFKKWEFPGGKLEPGESVSDALVREFKEETGINIHASTSLMEHHHDYPDRHVSLHVHTIDEYQGAVQALEGQALKWVTLDELEQLDFLQGNQVIIDALKHRRT